MKHSWKVHHLLGAPGRTEIKWLKTPQRTIEEGIRKNKARMKDNLCFLFPMEDRQESCQCSLKERRKM